MGRILVTGCAGLIGSHVVETLLKADHYVIGVDDLSYGSNMNGHPNFKFVKSKVQDFTNVGELDAVFHLATLKKTFSGVKCDASEVMINSVTMAERIKSICKSTGAFLIFSSTSDVYSNSTTFNETDRLTIGPPNIKRYSYAVTKLWEEQYYMDLFKEGYIEGSIARIFGCTSPRAAKGWSGGHIPLFLHKAMQGDDIIIHGDGLQTRSICHAESISTGLIRMYDRKQLTRSEIFNLGSDKQMSVRDAAELINTIAGNNSKIKYISTTEAFGEYPEIQIRFADTDKARRVLGVTFDEELIDIVNEMINIWSVSSTH